MVLICRAVVARRLGLVSGRRVAAFPSIETVKFDRFGRRPDCVCDMALHTKRGICLSSLMHVSQSASYLRLGKGSSTSRLLG